MNSSESRTVLDRHFELLHLIREHYKGRNDDSQALGKATGFCIEQIALAPKAAEAFRLDRVYKQNGLPSHTGYEQLAIIYAKQGRYEEALELCTRAKKEGWGAGCTKGPVDWDKRISQYSKKLKAPTLQSQSSGLIELQCSNCSRTLRVPEQYAGTRGRCNYCGGGVEVPSIRS